MAEHELRIELPQRVVLHKDVTVAVWSDEVKLGELRVSKGSVDWVPHNHRFGFWMTWERFDDLMREEGRERRPRKPRQRKQPAKRKRT